MEVKVIEPLDERGYPGKRVTSSVEDHGDGTYLLKWRSEQSGTFEAHVMIGGRHIQGSPTPLRLDPDVVDLHSTEVVGFGLNEGRVGASGSFFINFKDKYGNPSRPPPWWKTEMCVLSGSDETRKRQEKEERRQEEEARRRGQASSGDPKAGKAAKARAEKERWKTTTPMPITTTWEGGQEVLSEGEEDQTGANLKIEYVPRVAGDSELHLWCRRGATEEAVEEAEREPLPGSPFTVFIMAGEDGKRRRGATLSSVELAALAVARVQPSERTSARG